MRVASSGLVFVHNASTLSVFDASSAATVVEMLSNLLGYAVKVRDDGYVILCTESQGDGQLPVSVSVIPTSRTASPTKARLTIEDLRPLYPSLAHAEAVLVDMSQPAFIASSEDMSVEVGPYGGHFILAPLHVLEETEEKLPWSLAPLCPSSSAHVQANVTLPTPPPSPPVAIIPLGSSTSVPVDLERSSTGMTIALSSMPSFAEMAEKHLEDAAPLTPLSPPIQPQPELGQQSEPELDTERDKREERIVPSTSFSQPIRGGLLRLLFAWLFRALLARVWGLFGRTCRTWGLTWIASNDEEILFKDGAVTGSVDTPPQMEEPKHVEEKHSNEEEEPLSASSSTFPAVSPSETTLADDELPDKEDYLPSKLEEAPSMETVVPALDSPTHIHVSPHSLCRSRFLADIHSNAVSLLVRAPHRRRTLSELNITIGGKRVHDTDSAYSYERLSENVYLLGLHGPEDSNRLEISLD